MNKIATHILIVTTMLLLFSAVVFAAHDIDVVLTSTSTDFVITAPTSSFSVCQCGSIIDSISITNTGSLPDRYTLELNQEYVTPALTSVDLAGGETTEIPLYVNAPCSKSGKDLLEIIVTSIYGQTQFIEQEILFVDCQNMYIDLAEENLTSGVCEPFSTSFTITNAGQFTETYEVFLGDFAEFATLNTNKVTLASQNAADINIYYDLPCNEYGNITLDYTVQAIKNMHKAEFSQQLFVNQTYEFAFTANPITLVCEEETAEYVVRLNNDNAFDDFFALDLLGPSCIDVELLNPLTDETLNNVLVKAGESREIKVSFNPAEKHFGINNFSIHATSLQGDVTRAFATSIEVLDCYNFKNHLDVPYSDLHVCGLDTLSRPFEIKNNGAADIGVELVLTAPNFLSVDESFMELEPFSTQSSYFNFTDVRNETMRYPITLSSYFRGELVAEENFDLHVNTIQECYMVAPQKKTVDVHYTKDSFTLPIQNKGTTYGWYSAEFIDTNALSIENSFIDLGKTEVKDLTIFIDEEELLLQAMDDNASLIGYTLETSLLLTHIDSGLTFTYPVTITVVDYPWTRYAWQTIIAQTPCTIAFFMLVIIFAVLLFILIIKLALRSIFRSRKTLGFIVLGLMIIALISVLLIWGVPQKSDYVTTYNLETNSTTYLRLAEDSPRVFDMYDFFSDPDGDIEEFGVNVIYEDVLSSKVRGSKIKLIPFTDWSGSTVVQFYAIDSYGVRAQSPDIFVEVLPVEDYTLKQCFAMTCVYVNLIMLLVVAILFFVIVSLRSRKKELARQNAIKQAEAEALKQKRAEERAQKKEAKERRKLERQVAQEQKNSLKKTTTKKASKRIVQKSVARKSSKKLSTKNSTSARSNNVAKK
ncbi:hypothetical protein K9M74_04520 [Candidatus Woesearchaeota archaeon]|nr:hypothetical protein [Candidatus Woesearchaeota archaeon]